MSALGEALDLYLALRRGLGTELRRVGGYLRRFVEFADRQGAAVITTELALRWATASANAAPASRVVRVMPITLPGTCGSITRSMTDTLFI